jgi:transcriptional regulator with XRE-family HTH domain
MKLPMLTKLVPDNIKSGREIRMARIKKQMSLKRLAHLLGIAPSSLLDLEQGKRNWDEDRFAKAQMFIAEYRA